MMRKLREDAMSLAELAEEAEDWKEMMDPITDKLYYRNIISLENFEGVPRSVQAKKQLVGPLNIIITIIINF